VRTQAIDPRNFKDTNDVGTLAVRYVVMPQGEKNTVLRIDALFEEDFRRTVHKSDGSVENANTRTSGNISTASRSMKAQNIEARKSARSSWGKQNLARHNGSDNGNDCGGWNGSAALSAK